MQNDKSKIRIFKFGKQWLPYFTFLDKMAGMDC